MCVQLVNEQHTVYCSQEKTIYNHLSKTLLKKAVSKYRETFLLGDGGLKGYNRTLLTHSVSVLLIRVVYLTSLSVFSGK